MIKKRPYRKVVYRKKIMILLVQIVNRNLGDTVIADSAAYLIGQVLPWYGRQHYVIQHYDIQSEDYELVRLADMIIFDGGGLIKYRQEHFHQYVPALLACAEECGIPVYFNSVGVEGYDAQDERCLGLAQALNYNCVKGITVRDDMETLRRDYLKTDRIFTAAAVDPAIFTPQVYGIQKDDSSHIIGLGVVRSRIFEDYGIPEVTREFQLELWRGIIQQLEHNGYQWKLFVNGLRADYDFAEEILEYLGRTSQAQQYLVPRPIESRELVETIASFEGVIACRMHANIIAYALGVPSVGLVWNDKMVFWGERIGYPERFLSSGQFEPIRVVQCLMESISDGVKLGGSFMKTMKRSLTKPLGQFVKKYGAAAWKKKSRAYVPKPMDWSARLAASALGGIHMRYTNMNTPKGLEQAAEHGFRIFEADVRLTKDGQLVCVNGWSNGSYEKLGVNPQDYADGMDYGTFLKCRMYGNFETMDTARLFERMKREEGDWKLILDIGKPNKEVLADMIAMLRELCGSTAEQDASGDDSSMSDKQCVSSSAQDASGDDSSMSDKQCVSSSAQDASGDDNSMSDEQYGSMIRQHGSDCLKAEPDGAPDKELSYWADHLYIRVQSKYDVEAVQESGLPMQIMYYIPPKQRREEKNLSLDSIGKYCKKRKIQWLSMPKEALDDEVTAFLKKEKLKSCLFSYNSYTEVSQALEMGIDWVGTSYLSPEQMNEWYEWKYIIVIR